MSRVLRACLRYAVGLGILVVCFLTGQTLRTALGLIVPGNILGLFLLLGLLGTGIVRLAWIEEGAALLLWLLPLLFLPVFVGAAEDRSFWAERGIAFAGATLVGLLALWATVGHLAQWLFARLSAKNPAHDAPGPLTDAEMTAAAAEVEDL